MTAIKRYRRKPNPVTSDDNAAVKYEPLMDLTDALTVARMADSAAEVTEVTFPSGKRVLLARWTRYDDDHPAETEYEAVEPGDYLAYSAGTSSLYSNDDDDWRGFYDEVTTDGT